MTKLVRKVRRMDEFQIDEVSSVDIPAQIPAQALILKAAGDAELRKRVRLTSVEDGHQHLIDMSGDHGSTSNDMATGDEFSHSHPWVRNDDNSITVGLSDGHTHTVIMKMATDEDLAAMPGNSLKPAISGGGPNGEIPMAKTDEEIAAAEAKAVIEKRIADAEARAEKAEQLASMTDVQKAHYGTLSPEAQAEFLGAAPDVRQASVTKAQGEDPVVYTTLAGEEIRKSAGTLLLNLAKRADQSEQDLAVEKAARERETFAKRAKDELNNLPGEESAQVALLKAVAGIADAGDRKAVGEILAAANSGVSKAFETAGSIAGGDSDVAAGAEAKLEKMAQTHFEASGEGGSFQKSYKSVLQTPAGRELYMQSKRS